MLRGMNGEDGCLAIYALVIEFRSGVAEIWRSLGESNPCFSLERAAS